MAEEAPFTWQVKISVARDMSIFLSVSSLMELRNLMGQSQEEMNYHPQSLALVDYIIQAAQYTATRGNVQ